MRPSRRQTQPFIRPWSAGRPTATVVLIALHAGAFAAQMLLELIQQDRFLAHNWLQQWLAFGGEAVANHQYWTFFTHLLLHDGPWPWHLMGNLVVLFFAGREVEPIIGPRQFLGLYSLGLFVGMIAHWMFLPGYPLVGVSAGVAAILAAYATILPELEVIVHLFFVLPLRMKAKYLGLGLLAASGVLWITLTAPQIGPAGMFAGCFVGWLYVRQLGFGNPFWFQRIIFEKRQREARLARMPADQFVNEEIDPILDKISREGLESLSRAERRILEQGSEKIASRDSHC